MEGDYFCCCRVCLRAKSSAAHPRLRLNMLEPIFRRRDPTQIIGDMLLANSAYGNEFTFTVLYGRSKNRCTQKNTLAVMSKSAVPKVGKMSLLSSNQTWIAK